MERLKYLAFVLATVTLSDAVKINMKGSVSLGKEVLETISHMMQKSGALPVAARRSGGGPLSVPATDNGPDQIKVAIHFANIGRDLKIYNGSVGEFIKEYIFVLATAVESIFDGILTKNHGLQKEIKSAIFVEQLKPVLADIHEILKEANTKIIEEKQKFEWVTVIKRISARYQKAAIKFVTERLDGDPQDILNVKKKLIQKLIIAIVLVENKYEKVLCDEYQICQSDQVVTTALHSLLGAFEKAENRKAMEFMKYFYENLPENLFHFINMDTTHELQVILSDLSYAKNAPTREVLLTVDKSVDARLKLLTDNVEMSKAFDQQLVNVILSDMDYNYRSRHKSYPFDAFLQQFTAWLKNGGKFGLQMRTIFAVLREKLKVQTPDLIEKLGFEARVFLELTVDPEN